ncbi:hypothetical protein [Thalassotalea sp. ND16A]|uniref:hypothetical protein n=1 Tax=Thalassotalea sp. ND16A TaxID=1535422 RepID=UPI00126A1F80|nr:hypothetical protein [Thalassotalea sp. ND16A]
MLVNSDDRRIELACHHEALYNPKLSVLLLNSWRGEVTRLTRLFELMGTDAPEEDVEITFAIILQLEKRQCYCLCLLLSFFHW